MSDIIKNFKIKQGLTVSGSLIHTTEDNKVGIRTNTPSPGSTLDISGALSASNYGANPHYDDSAKNVALSLSGSIRLTSGSKIDMQPVEIGRLARAEEGGLALGSNSSATGRNGISIGTGYAYNWGLNSIAIGYKAAVRHPLGANDFAARSAIAIGEETITDGAYALSMGYHTTASAPYSIAIGASANSGMGFGGAAVTHFQDAGATHSISIGTLATVTKTGTGSIAIGQSNYTNYPANVLLGQSNKVSVIGEAYEPMQWEKYSYNVSIGQSNVMSSDYSVALGASNDISGSRSIGIGFNNIVSGSDSLGLGNRSQISASDFAIAIGREATSSTDYSIALGYKSIANKDNVSATGYGISIGSEARAEHGSNQIAIGQKSKATGSGAIAIGRESQVGNEGNILGHSIAIGDKVQSQGWQSVSIGTGYPNGDMDNIMFNMAMGGIAIGAGAGLHHNPGWYGTALGVQARGSNYSIAIGKEAETTNSQSIAIGNKAKVTGKNSMLISLEGGENGSTGQPDPAQVTLAANNVFSLMSTDSTGTVLPRLGVGTLTPEKEFTVSGSISASGNIHLSAPAGVSDYSRGHLIVGSNSKMYVAGDTSKYIGISSTAITLDTQVLNFLGRTRTMFHKTKVNINPYSPDDWNIVASEALTLSGSMSASGDIYLGGDLNQGHLSASGDVSASNLFGKYNISGSSLDVYTSTFRGNSNFTDGEISASVPISASTMFVSGGMKIGEGLDVVGIITAQELHTHYTASTVLYTSGSSAFGDTDDDEHRFTGSFSVSGSGPHHILGGNFGIGTGDNPPKTLTVEGDLSASGHLYLKNNKEIRQQDTTGTERTIIELDNSDDLNIGGSYGGALKFIGGGSYAEQMRIHDDGKVGIGTNTPVEKLTVDGNISSSGHYYTEGNISSSGKFYGRDLDGNGNKYRLEVEGDLSASNLITKGYISSSGPIYVGSDTTGGTLSEATRSINFGVDASDRARIYSTKDGTTSNLVMEIDDDTTDALIIRTKGYGQDRVDRRGGLTLQGGQIKNIISVNTASSQYTGFHIQHENSGSSGTGITSSLYMSSSGNMIIGGGATSLTPYAPLHISYSNDSNSISSSWDTPIQNNRPSLLIQNASETSGSWSGIDFRSYTADARIALQNTSTNRGDLHFIVDDNNNPKTAMIIKDQGWIGIGAQRNWEEDPPEEALHVSGGISASGYIIASAKNESGGGSGARKNRIGFMKTVGAAEGDWQSYIESDYQNDKFGIWVDDGSIPGGGTREYLELGGNWTMISASTGLEIKGGGTADRLARFIQTNVNSIGMEGLQVRGTVSASRGMYIGGTNPVNAWGDVGTFISMSNGNVSSSGNIHIGGALTASDSKFVEPVTYDQGFTVAGAITASGNISCSGDLTIGGVVNNHITMSHNVKPGIQLWDNDGTSGTENDKVNLYQHGKNTYWNMKHQIGQTMFFQTQEDSGLLTLSSSVVSVGNPSPPLETESPGYALYVNDTSSPYQNAISSSGNYTTRNGMFLRWANDTGTGNASAYEAWIQSNQNKFYFGSGSKSGANALHRNIVFDLASETKNPKVGIGDLYPNQTLVVSGTLSASGQSYLEKLRVGNWSNKTTTQSSFGGGGQPTFFVSQSNNLAAVGIDTAGKKFFIGGAGDVGTYNAGVYIGSHNAVNLQLLTDNKIRMTISSSNGAVGIGTTYNVPVPEMLTVSGSISASGDLHIDGTISVADFSTTAITASALSASGGVDGELGYFNTLGASTGSFLRGIDVGSGYNGIVITGSGVQDGIIANRRYPLQTYTKFKQNEISFNVGATSLNGNNAMEIQSVSQGTQTFGGLTINPLNMNDKHFTVNSDNHYQFFHIDVANEVGSIGGQGSTSASMFNVKEDLYVGTNITASGIISSSNPIFVGGVVSNGTVQATTIHPTGKISGSSTSTLSVGGSSSFGDGINVDGSITASGNISCSGALYGGTLYSQGKLVGSSDGTKVIIGNINTPTFIHGSITASGGHISASGDLFVNDISEVQHITASGNISSSGNLFVNDITMTGEVSELTSSTYLSVNKDNNRARILINRTDSSINSGNIIGDITWTGTDPNPNMEGAQISVVAADAWSTNDAACDMIFKVNGGSTGASEKGRIKANGMLHWDTGGGTGLGISGSIFRSSGDVIAYNTSDERLKYNVETITNPIEKVQQLRGVRYNWGSNQTVYEQGTNDSGIIAQDVQKVLPELVRTNSNGYLGVKHEKLVGLLVEAVKEQQGQIEELKDEVRKLKGDK